MTKKLINLALCGLLLLAAGCQKPVTQEPDDVPVETVKPEDGKPIELENFTVTLTSLHSGDVFFNIQPKDETMTYWFARQVKEDMEANDEGTIAADREYFEYIADYYGLSLHELLSDNLFAGEKDWMYNSLSAKTEYVLYMYGLSTDGEPTTGVNQITFTTTKVGPVDCDFELVVGDNITARSFSITIVPSDDHVAYFYDIFPAAMYEEYCLSDPENLPAFMAEYIPALASENGVSIPTAVGAISAYGAITQDFTSEDGIEAANTYYVFVLGIGADGTATTDAEVISVTTARPPMNTFEVSTASIEDDRASFYVLPTQSESYVALFELQEYMYDAKGNPLSDEEIINAILAAQGDHIANHVYSGTSSVSECPLIPNKDYYCLVFGYFGGEVTTPLTKVPFKTKAADPQDVDFILTVGEPTTTSVSVSVQPYREPTPHMFNYMPYSTYVEYGANDEAIKRFNNELIDGLWNPAKMSREEWLSRALETSYNSWLIEGLEPNTKYVFYAIGLVPDGTYTTQAFVKEFTTKELKEGPQVDEILFSKSGNDVLAYFYLDGDSNVAKFVMSHIIDDASVYNMSDADLLTYLELDNETTFLNEVSNQTYFTIVDKNVSAGATIYYAGAVYDPEGNYTIIRHTYKK